MVHALDRTGPPMLALAFVRWLRSQRADAAVELVAFRGGELLDDALALAQVTVLLDPHEPWDHADPDPRRAASVRRRGAAVGPADVTLLVSVAASQCLPFVSPTSTLVTWAVERGEDLHWVDDVLGAPTAAIGTTDRWLAGASGTRAELLRRLGADLDVLLVPEFVDFGEAPPDVIGPRRRRAVLGASERLLVLGVGIATLRKAPDLFLEVALGYVRSGGAPATFCWIGGEGDPLFHLVLEESRRLGLDDTVRMVGATADVVPWLAAADVLLHPARLDAFPLVCLHAASTGTPVVGFAEVSGLEEMFGPSFEGVDFPDVGQMVDRLARLSDPDVRSSLASEQHAWARERFDVSVCAPRLHEALGTAHAGRAR